MSPEREMEIRRAWDSVSSKAMAHFRVSPVYYVAEHLPWRAPLGGDEAALQTERSVLEFVYQRSNPHPFEDRTERVVCDGLTVYGPVPIR